jgi:hypothetical protein
MLTKYISNSGAVWSRQIGMHYVVILFVIIVMTMMMSIVCMQFGPLPMIPVVSVLIGMIL